MPKQPAACHEAADRINRIKFLLGVPCSGIRDRQIDDGSGYINEGNGKNCRFGKRREADGIEVKQRKNRGQISVDEWNTMMTQARELVDQVERGELTYDELVQRLNAL